MTLGHRIALLVGLLVTALVPLGVGAGAATPDGPAERVKPVERYLYSATFEVDVTHGRRNVYPGPDNFDTENLSASVTGTLPNLEVTTKDVWRFIPRGTKTSARVARAEAKTTKSTNDGGTVERCAAETARVQGQPYYQPPGAVVPFAGLTFPASCTDSEGEVTAADLSLPVIGAQIIKSSEISPGEVSKTFKLRGDSKQWPGPGRDETDCPGYAQGSTVSCAYTVKGTLTLKLIKKLPTPKPKPKGASISKDATKAATTLSCTRNCTITIRLTPLAGGPTITVRRLSPAPIKPTKVTVPIPASKRNAVKRSGGVRMTMNYQVAGVSFSETRVARL